MIAPAPGKRRARFILPGLYLAVALYVWIDFATAARDGLANIGLFFVTFPVALFGLLIDWLVGSKEFSLLPENHGYLANHAIYYLPAAAFTMAFFWLIGQAIDRRPT